MVHKKQKLDAIVVGRTLANKTYLQHVKKPALPEVPEVLQKSKRSWKKRFALFLMLFFILILFIGSWNAINYSRASKKLFGSSNIISALTPSPLKGSDNGRVNILVVGYSADDPGHNGANLTDSIMVVSMSTADKGSYMLSIPRDLYISIPGYGRAKINEAFQNGQVNGFTDEGYPAGGIGLLEKTLSQSLNININYFMLVNYSAVRETTDAINGIEVNIQSSDPRGIFDPNFKPEEGGPLRLGNGRQSIDGQTALRLTRARGAAGGYGLLQSDFDRSKNQQAVLVGIANKINWSLLLNPLKNDALLDALANNVKTDVSVREALPLYRLLSRTTSPDMKTFTLRDLNGKNMLRSYTTPSGQAALVPLSGINDFSQIQAAIRGLND